MSSQKSLKNIPEYVESNLVVNFDIYSDQGMKDNLHLGLKALHDKAPDIFYTPCNGGHWMVTRYDLMEQVLRDTEHFSNKQLYIPKIDNDYKMIPLNLDPPEHAPFRGVLMRQFGSKTIAGMEPDLRHRASELIDQVIADGQCDFTETLGAAFPVSVFMKFMGMPLERFEEFRTIVHGFFSDISVDERVELQRQIFALNSELIEERRNKIGDDLLSALIESEVNGRPLTDEELLSICYVLFLGGMDTVANALTFSFAHLAQDEALRQRLVTDPAAIPNFVEESLRRYAVVNQTRIVKKDIDINGANFRVGDMVLCPLALGGLDERKNPEPEKFDVDRKNRQHITFSTGAHLCIGNVLARTEMRIFTEEWLKRVPEFSIPKEAKLIWRPSLVMALSSLPLEWPTDSQPH